MAFNIANLDLIGHGAGHRVWAYKSTADTLATIRASGYFGQDSTTGQQSSAMLAAGDKILVTGSDGEQMLRVDTISGNTVTTEVGAGEAQVFGIQIMNLQTSGSIYFPAPFDGKVGRVKAAINGDLANGTTEIAVQIGSVGVTGGNLQINNSGGTAGDVYQNTATGANSFTEGEALRVTWTGGVGAELTTTESDAYVTIELIPA